MSRASWDILWAARFVAKWEGLSLVAYQDSGGIWTIGYGHTGNVRSGEVITRATALRLLSKDLHDSARCVNRLFKRRLTVRQRIAAISFAFNVGCGGLEESTFLREANAGHPAAAAKALLLWDKDAAGHVLLGLQRRRAAERYIFLHQGKQARSIPVTHPRAKAHS